MSLIQAAYFYAPKYIKPTATAWVSGNTPKASHLEPEQRVVPLFLIVLNLSVMNYKKMKERIERKEEAVKNLIKFLATENDYSSMMTELAIAQSRAMKLAEIARIHGDKGYMQELYTFFITITDLLIWIKPLSDFAKLEEDED